jgi:hypothetical protein
MPIKKLNNNYVSINHKIENGFLKKIFEFKNHQDWHLAEERLDFFSKKSGVGSLIPQYNWKRSSNIFFIEQKLIQKSISQPSFINFKNLAIGLDGLNLELFPHGDLNRKNIIFHKNMFYLVDIEPIIVIERPNEKNMLRSTIPYIHKKDLEYQSVSILSDLLGFFCFILKAHGTEHSVIKKNHNQLCEVVQNFSYKPSPFFNLFIFSEFFKNELLNFDGGCKEN